MSTRQPNWKKIPGFPFRHEVSECGRVRTLAFVDAAGRYHGPREKRITVSSVGKNYKTSSIRVSDGDQSKLHLVSHLVAAAFIGDRPEGMEVLHIDGNPQNNAASNLRYGTRKENVADTYRHGRGIKAETHPMAKLTLAQVDEIKEKSKKGVMGKDIAAEFGVCESTVSVIKNSKSWVTA